MGPLLILDRNPVERHFVATLAKGQYEPIVEACDSRSAEEALLGLSERPALIVAALDPRDQEAIILLRWMHRSRSTIPVAVIAKGPARGLEPKARSLGARFFVYDPDNAREMQWAMQEAVRSRPGPRSSEPPITSEESGPSLSQLVNHLNGTMKCFAGRQQVFLHSFLESGQKAEPRVCLHCFIRNGLRLPHYVYYEHIRDICCGTPAKCEAMKSYLARAQQIANRGTAAASRLRGSGDVCDGE
jgi:hypothetical protein